MDYPFNDARNTPLQPGDAVTWWSSRYRRFINGKIIRLEIRACSQWNGELRKYEDAKPKIHCRVSGMYPRSRHDTSEKLYSTTLSINPTSLLKV